MRKLFIDNEGKTVLANKIKNYYDNNNEARFADTIEAQDYLVKELDIAKNLRGVESISIPKSGNMRVRTTDLFITDSSTGIVRKFFIGNWIVEFTTDNQIKFFSQNKDELGFHSSIWGDGTVHPHISGRANRGCLGSAEARASSILASG